MLKNWCLTFFLKKNMYSTIRPKKKIHCVLEFNKSQWLKTCFEMNKQKIIEADKWRRRWKSVVQINEPCCMR